MHYDNASQFVISRFELPVLQVHDRMSIYFFVVLLVHRNGKWSVFDFLLGFMFTADNYRSKPWMRVNC